VIARESDLRREQRPRRNSRVANLLPLAGLCVVIGVLYLFSYASAVRFAARRTKVPTRSELRFAVDVWQDVTFPDGQRFPIYRPVDRLIDRSPVRPVLLWWADVWGVGEQFRAASWYRVQCRYRPGPPPTYRL